MGAKVLVVYATWHGSTEGVARRVAERLAGAGAAVDVAEAGAAADVAGRDAVVVGGAIRMGSLHPRARKFLAHHRAALAGKKVALFCVCLAAKDSTDESRTETDGYLKAARDAFPEVTFVETAAFAGAYIRERASWPVRLLFRAMHQPPADFRDWAAIDAWSAKVAAAFGVGPR